MRSFFKKLYICLFSPKRICFYFGEKVYKSILQLLLLSLIAITPVILTLSFTERMGNDSYRVLEECLMEKYSEFDVAINDGVLEGEKSYAFITNEAIVYINPTGEELEYSSLDQMLYFVIELKKDNVEVSFMNSLVSSKTYEELNVTDLDFNKINEANYTEFDKFISILNQSFKSYKSGYVLVNSSLALLDVYLTIILSSLLLAIIVKFFNHNLPFVIRFKGALDSQVISLVFVLLMLLFNFEFLRYVGMLFAAVYLVITVIQVLKIEMVMKSFENKE